MLLTCKVFMDAPIALYLDECVTNSLSQHPGTRLHALLASCKTPHHVMGADRTRRGDVLTLRKPGEQRDLHSRTQKAAEVLHDKLGCVNTAVSITHHVEHALWSRQRSGGGPKSRQRMSSPEGKRHLFAALT